MESSTTRNKVEARRIESWLHSQIAELGTTNIAKVAGVNKSTVSRWRESLLPNMSLLLAILISNRPQCGNTNGFQVQKRRGNCEVIMPGNFEYVNHREGEQ